MILLLLRAQRARLGNDKRSIENGCPGAPPYIMPDMLPTSLCNPLMCCFLQPYHLKLRRASSLWRVFNFERCRIKQKEREGKTEIAAPNRGVQDKTHPCFSFSSQLTVAKNQKYMHRTLHERQMQRKGKIAVLTIHVRMRENKPKPGRCGSVTAGCTLAGLRPRGKSQWRQLSLRCSG